MLISGLIGIAGSIIVKLYLDMLTYECEEITDIHMENRELINDIRTVLYRHQSVILNYIVTDDETAADKLKISSDDLLEQAKNSISEYGERIEGEQGEQHYHKMYSNFYSYVRNVDLVMDYCRNGEKDTALYYVENILNPLIEGVNESLENMDALTVEELNKSADEMSSYIDISHFSLDVFIFCISVTTVLTLVFCSRLTYSLENYKDSLEKEIEEKKDDLRRHNEKMMSIQNNTIIGMANLIESRDGDTGEHVKRTSKYVDMLARGAREKGVYADVFTDSFIELLDKAAPLHDIGKISVPDSILQKPGKLTPEEFETIKSHAAEGGRIIREVMGSIEEKEYVDIAVTVASCHHEKWDGSGYPNHLKGYEIPIAARIMALADVFDALVSKRCYKRPMSVDEAFKIIKDSEGTHFDPDLAEVFISLKPEIENYLNSPKN